MRNLELELNTVLNPPFFLLSRDFGLFNSVPSVINRTSMNIVFVVIAVCFSNKNLTNEAWLALNPQQSSCLSTKKYKYEPRAPV